MIATRRALAVLLLCASTEAWSQSLPPNLSPSPGKGEVHRATPPPPPVPLPQCTSTLPPLRSPLAFASGERLEFDLDALGATAGKLTIEVLKNQEGTLPVQVQVQTNTFFSKVRRVNATAVSYLHPKTLRTARYTEDATENEVHHTMDVAFNPKNRSAHVAFTQKGLPGTKDLTYEHEGMDVAGAIYMMRQLPMKEGLPVCLDVFGVRQMWRLTGSVLKREHVSLPLGEFEAWHLSGTAVRMDRPAVSRDIHVWISDDERRLPLAVLGTIDLGAVRATLTALSRPGEKSRQATGREQLKW